MKKRYYKLISLCLAGWMMMNGTSISYAAEVSCTEEVQEGSPTVEGVSEEHTAQTDENEETVDDIPDLVVQGTGENEITENSGEELIIAGTEESRAPVVAIPSNVDNEILNSALVKVENYLSAAVTNPVSDTINGEWSVIAMARYGVLSEEAKNNYLANLYEELDQTDGVLDSNKYTEYSRAILALTALGKNPSDVKGYDLLYYLADFNKVKFQGINGSIWALLALDSYQYEIPELSAEDLGKGKIQTTREKLIQEILDREIEGGGWALGAGSGADPDITAMAVMAIAPYTHQRQDVRSAFDRGIEKLSNMQNEFQGGDLTIVSSDDGLNAAGGNDASGTTGGRDGMFGGGGKSFSSDGTIVISGGTLYVNASGDGIDANGSVEMTGGSVTVAGPTQGDTSTLDYDTTATIAGGTFVGTGAAGMAQTFSDSQQGVLSVNVGNQSAGTTVSICDSQGNTVADFVPELSFQVVIFSDPQLVSGETYTITVGTVSQEIEAQ